MSVQNCILYKSIFPSQQESLCLFYVVEAPEAILMAVFPFFVSNITQFLLGTWLLKIKMTFPSFLCSYIYLDDQFWTMKYKWKCFVAVYRKPPLKRY